MPRERPVDHLALALEAALVDAGAVTGKARAVAAEQGRGNCRCRRGVADPHLAQDHEIGVARERVVACRHAFEEHALVHGRIRE